MSFDFSYEKTHADVRKNIKFPTQMSTELAELLGVMMGDGSLNVYRRKGKADYNIEIAGHKQEDYEYLVRRVRPLFKKLFNLEVQVKLRKNQNTAIIKLQSKNLLLFLHMLGLPLGPKTDLSLPKSVTASNHAVDFIRGLADTDFSLMFKKKHKNKHYYPVIKGELQCKMLIKDVGKSLDLIGISYNTQYDYPRYDKRRNTSFIGHSIYICGKSNLQKWLDTIGFNNPKHMTKYYVWKQYGYCPPSTTYSDRLYILSNGLSPKDFYN